MGLIATIAACFIGMTSMSWVRSNYFRVSVPHPAFDAVDLPEIVAGLGPATLVPPSDMFKWQCAAPQQAPS